MICNACIYIAYGFLGRRRQETFLAGAYVRWARYALDIFGVALEVQGRECVPGSAQGPRVLLCNHQSQLDIPALVAALEEKIGFVAKKELGRIPLLAYWMREVGCIFIDRSRQSDARKSLEIAATQLGKNPLVVFPEGTRSKTGALLPIKLGGLRMAVLAGAQIVPVHVGNSRSACEARAPGARAPIPVRLHFFPPLNAKGWADGKESWLKVKDYLERCWKEGEAEGVGDGGRG